MDYNPVGNNLERAVYLGEDTRALLQRIADLGADYWRTHSHRRTGHNATSVVGYVDSGNGHQYGVVYADCRYARYREHGTRHQAAEHLMSGYLDMIQGF